MIFDMKVSENFASFFEGTTFVAIDSFDNYNFNVRIGTLSSTKDVANITASTDDELNAKLSNLYAKIVGTP